MWPSRRKAIGGTSARRARMRRGWPKGGDKVPRKRKALKSGAKAEIFLDIRPSPLRTSFESLGTGHAVVKCSSGGDRGRSQRVSVKSATEGQ
jgi:hypothetical protein